MRGVSPSSLWPLAILALWAAQASFVKGGSGSTSRGRPLLAFGWKKASVNTTRVHVDAPAWVRSQNITSHGSVHIQNLIVSLPGATSSPGGPINSSKNTLGGTAFMMEAGPRSPMVALFAHATHLIGVAVLEAFCMYVASQIVGAFQRLTQGSLTKSPDVRMSDVIGCNYAKEEILQIIDYLKAPEKYKRLGARIPRGVLLVGPPGVGKTMLAKALAGEAGVPFFYASGSDFANPFWGVGVLKIKKIFNAARKMRRSIIFIDEFDALARGRRTVSGGSAEMDQENTLNQLLTEMDGFNTFRHDTIVLGSTNRPEVLDKAVIRPGRFDRKIYMEAPDIEGRQLLFQKRLNKYVDKTDSERLSKLLAKLTPGFVGADIVNVVNEAAIKASVLNRTAITEEDLSWAVDRTGFGVGKTRKISQEDLHRTSVHEIGHAILSWVLPGANPPVKVSIVSKGGTGGFNLLGETNRTYHTAREFRDQLCAVFGGRAAEEVLLGSASQGASNDLEKATAIATAMVTNFGYGRKTGLLSWGGYSSPSTRTQQVAEEEVQELLREEYKRAVGIIKKRKVEVERLAELLLEKEVIHEGQIAEVLGSREMAAESDSGSSRSSGLALFSLLSAD